MDDIFVVGAFYGDDKKMTDVTSALGEKLADSGARPNIKVNSKLVPVMSGPDTYTLSAEEESRARWFAYAKCAPPGGDIKNLDTECYKGKFQEAKTSILEEKARNAYSADKVIEGPYLKIATLINGKPKEVKIPEGHAITLDSLQGRAPTRNAPFDLKKTMQLGRVAGKDASLSLGDVVRKIVAFVGPVILAMLGAGLYALSILITWKIFGDEGYRLLKFGMTILAALVPFSGFFVTPTFFGVRAFVRRIKPAMDAAAVAQKQSL